MRARMLLIPLLIAAQTVSARADSLWRNAGNHERNIYSDTKARRVGDIVTIIIQESASITKEKETEYKKDSTTDFEIELLKLLGLDKYPHTDGDTPALKMKSNSTFKGEADYDTKETFTKTMTAVVTEVLPNGNLIIEGTSDVVTDDEITTVTVSGTIRPEDITPDNQISSQRIASARISYQAKGPMKQNTRRGWLGRFLDRFWPF